MAVNSAPGKTVEERLRRMEDWLGVLYNLNQYSRALDYGRDEKLFVDCFVEDGVWRSTIDAPRWAGASGVTLRGHKELAAWALRSGRSNPDWPTTHRWGKHVYTDPDIRIDGDTATSDCYFFTPTSSESGPFLHSMGRYEDKLMRCPDGRWRFVERHLRREGADPESQKKPAG